MSNISIPHDVANLSQRLALDFQKMMGVPMPEQIEAGQIWSTRAYFELSDGRRFETDDPRLIVVLDGIGSLSESMARVTVAPVSVSTSYATDFDLLVTPIASPLGFDFMAEIWNETPTVKGQLKHFLGHLSDAASNALNSIYSAHLLDEDIPFEMREWVGPSIVSEYDSRLDFQESEVRAVQYLGQAASAVLELELATRPSATKMADRDQPRKIFECTPFWGRLGELAASRNFAHAASSSDEKTFIAKKEGLFGLELLCHRSKPYPVYVKVIWIAPELSGQKCIVVLITTNKTWRSMLVELQPNEKIPVGDSFFDGLEDIEKVCLELEDV